MSNIQRIGSDVTVMGGVNIGSQLTDFPSNPIPNTYYTINDVVYLYTYVKGVATYFPVTNLSNSMVITQAIASNTWTLTHNLSYMYPFIQVVTTDGQMFSPGYTPVDANSLIINFNEAIAGYALIISPEQLQINSDAAPEFVTEPSLTSVLSGYVTNNSLVASLAAYSPSGDYVTGTQLQDAIQTITGVTPATLSTLEQIDALLTSDTSSIAALTTSLNGILIDYITNEYLSSSLSDYVTNSALTIALENINLSNYVTTTALNTALSNINLSNYVSNSALSSTL